MIKRDLGFGLRLLATRIPSLEGRTPNPEHRMAFSPLALIDTHCHIQTAEFASDVDDVLNRAKRFSRKLRQKCATFWRSQRRGRYGRSGVKRLARVIESTRPRCCSLGSSWTNDKEGFGVRPSVTRNPDSESRRPNTESRTPHGFFSPRID